MYFVLLAAALAILAGVVVVAMGRGGEIAPSRRDVPVRPPRIRTAADVAMLRLPLGVFGYAELATDEALDAAARLIAEQDAEIARLRHELWRMRAQRADEQLRDREAAHPDLKDTTVGVTDVNDSDVRDSDVRDTDVRDTDVGDASSGDPDTGKPTAGDPVTKAAARPRPLPVGSQSWPKQ